MPETKDIRLVVEIHNKQPIELVDLTKSFTAIANQFNNYAAKEGDSKESRAARLYVKEIRQGSVIMELVEYATIGVLPFVENINTIVGFTEYLKKGYDYVLGKRDDKPKEFSAQDLKDLSNIVAPVANNIDSELVVVTKIEGDLNMTFNIGTTEANAIQNIVERTMKQLRVPEDGDEIKRKVLLTFYQIRSDIKAKTGNKGIIEEISPTPVNILFDPESLNEEMLHGDFNPNETVYVVDALPQTANGKIASYKISKLHETFEKPE